MAAGRSLALLLCVLVLAACGFRPLYGTNSTLDGGTTWLDQVAIGTISGVNSHRIKNELVDRFYSKGYPHQARYMLEAGAHESYRDIVIQKDDVISRSQLVVQLAYTLRDRQTGAVVDRGNLRAVGAYNILASQYTTVVTRNKARELAIREIADDLTLRLAVVIDEQQNKSAE